MLDATTRYGRVSYTLRAEGGSEDAASDWDSSSSPSSSSHSSSSPECANVCAKCSMVSIEVSVLLTLFVNL